MSSTEQRSASAFVGGMPENYEAHLRSFLFDGYAADLASRVAGEHPRSVLELACGTGAVTANLVRLLPDVRIVATDISEDMIEIARRKLGEKVEWAVVDAQVPPFADGEFDAIVCQFGVMFFPDKVQAYREAKRVLSSGSALHFNTWAEMEANPFAKVSHDTLARLFPNDPPQFFTIPFGYADRAQVESDLREAGFDSISIDRVDLQTGAIPAESAATGLVRGGPLAAKLEELGADLERIEAEFVRVIRDEFGDPAISPLSAFVVRAA